MEKTILIGAFTYIVNNEPIEVNSWFIQLDGGDGSPILRKAVTSDEYEKLGGIKNWENLGYYPYTVYPFLNNDSIESETRIKVISSNNPIVKL